MESSRRERRNEGVQEWERESSDDNIRSLPLPDSAAAKVSSGASGKKEQKLARAEREGGNRRTGG